MALRQRPPMFFSSEPDAPGTDRQGTMEASPDVSNFDSDVLSVDRGVVVRLDPFPPSVSCSTTSTPAKPVTSRCLLLRYRHPPHRFSAHGYCVPRPCVVFRDGLRRAAPLGCPRKVMNVTRALLSALASAGDETYLPSVLHAHSDP